MDSGMANITGKQNIRHMQIIIHLAASILRTTNTTEQVTLDASPYIPAMIMERRSSQRLIISDIESLLTKSGRCINAVVLSGTRLR